MLVLWTFRARQASSPRWHYWNCHGPAAVELSANLKVLTLKPWTLSRAIRGQRQVKPSSLNNHPLREFQPCSWKNTFKNKTKLPRTLYPGSMRARVFSMALGEWHDFIHGGYQLYTPRLDGKIVRKLPEEWFPYWGSCCMRNQTHTYMSQEGYLAHQVPKQWVPKGP